MSAIVPSSWFDKLTMRLGPTQPPSTDRRPETRSPTSSRKRASRVIRDRYKLKRRHFCDPA